MGFVNKAILPLMLTKLIWTVVVSAALLCNSHARHTQADVAYSS